MRITPLMLTIVTVMSFTAVGEVLLNEMEFNPPDNGSQWVELYNPGAEAADIGGWTAVLTDGSWAGKMSVPNGTWIEGKGFYVVYGDSRWHHRDSCFALLFDISGEKVDESPTRSDLLGNDLTWGRYPDGRDTNTAGDWGYMMATRGEPNQI